MWITGGKNSYSFTRLAEKLRVLIMSLKQVSEVALLSKKPLLFAPHDQFKAQ